MKPLAQAAVTIAALLLVWLTPACAEQKSGRPAFATEIMFQAFTWDANVEGKPGVWYKHVQTQLDELAGAGVTHVWFPPPSRSVAPQGYMPGDLYDLGTAENPTLYGTKDDLKATLAAFKQRGIVCLADAVLNHRCASHQENGVWNVFHHASGKAKWERWALAKGDYDGSGAADTGANFDAAPDVDHANPKVRADISEWLKWLRDDVGFNGLRFDFSKGYGASFVKEYVDAFGPEMAVGEYWSSMGYEHSEMLPNQDQHRQTLCDWMDGARGSSMAFDFTTKGLLQEALKRGQFWRLRDRSGKAAGLIGWWADHSVTFVDNHDTGSTQAHWPFPGDKVLAGYAYIMTHPGVPTIFWDHFVTWGPDHRATIKKLAQLRHDMRIHRASQLEIVHADDGRYVAKVDGKLVVKLGPGGYQPETGWRERMSGPGFTIWTKE
jgi:alpha-amylase